jgi:hypothetical protein
VLGLPHLPAFRGDAAPGSCLRGVDDPDDDRDDDDEADTCGDDGDHGDHLPFRVAMEEDFPVLDTFKLDIVIAPFPL